MRRKRKQLDWGAPMVEHIVTYDEAVKMARSRKYRYRYVFVGTHCPLKVNDLHGATTRYYYTASAAVRVTLPALLSFMRNAFPEHVRGKVNVLVSTSDGFIWIGRSP